MAFRFEESGMDELIEKMSKLEKQGQDIASQALYVGAGVLADQVSAAVQGIATKRLKYPAPPGKTRMPSPEEKAVLVNARKGVAKFKKTGIRVDTSVGFQNSGYGQINGKTVPVPAIANAINSGTSFMKKQPFLRKALRTSKAMQTIENELQKRLDELSLD